MRAISTAFSVPQVHSGTIASARLRPRGVTALIHAWRYLLVVGARQYMICLEILQLLDQHLVADALHQALEFAVALRPVAQEKLRPPAGSARCCRSRARARCSCGTRLGLRSRRLRSALRRGQGRARQPRHCPRQRRGREPASAWQDHRGAHRRDLRHPCEGCDLYRSAGAAAERARRFSRR